MRPPVRIGTGLNHLQDVKWPEDLLGPNYWRPDYTITWDVPENIKEQVKMVAESSVRFYQKVKRQPAPMIRGDNADPDATHALEIALNRQDELETAIKPLNDHVIEKVMMWLQERKKFLVKSMQAVVVAERGEMYDEASKRPWEVKLGKMTIEHVDQLRFIFRTVMARIDLDLMGKPHIEEVQSTFDTAIVQYQENIQFPAAPCGSSWKIDDSLMENSTLKMRQAALALYHHGRVLSATWANLANMDKELWDLIIRAVVLTIRSIDLIWIERKQDLAKEEEKRLLARLRECKDTVVGLRFNMIDSQLSAAYHHHTVKIDNSGRIFVKENGEFLESGRWYFAPEKSL